MTKRNLIWVVVGLVSMSGACDRDDPTDDDSAGDTAAAMTDGAEGGPDEGAEGGPADGADDAPDDSADDAPDDGADDAPDDGDAEDGADDAPGDGGPDDGADDAPDDGAEGPTFTELYEPIFVDGGCSAGYCHGGGAGGLPMHTLDAAYEALTGVAATLGDCGLTMRVVAGDPDASILWARVAPLEVDPTDGCFTSMPKDADKLAPEQADQIRAWIAAGAPL